MTQRTPQRRRNHSNPEKQEGFFPGLVSLMAKQCIFAAMIFAALYYIKNANLPFSEPVSSFVKEAVGYNMTVETIKNFAAGIFS